jgi:hypothetical protein
MRNLPVERTWTVIVSGCASKVVCAWFWVFNGSKIFNWAWVCVIHESACVVCASSMRDCTEHTSAVSGYASAELVRNRACPRPSTDAPRSYHAWTAHSLTCAEQKCFYVERLLSVRDILNALRQWFMRRVCVGCSWNTTPYFLVCVDVRDMSVSKWYVRGSCVICQWFLPWHPLKIGQCLDTQAQSVRDLWVIRAWSDIRFYIIKGQTCGKQIRERTYKDGLWM